MKAILQKINANPLDKADSIQFRIEKEEIGDKLLQIRRGQMIHILVSSIQTSIQADKDGVIIAPEEIKFESDSISISICVLVDGLIATITVGVEDKEIAAQILNKDLRGMEVELKFI